MPSRFLPFCHNMCSLFSQCLHKRGSGLWAKMPFMYAWSLMKSTIMLLLIYILITKSNVMLTLLVWCMFLQTSLVNYQSNRHANKHNDHTRPVPLEAMKPLGCTAHFSISYRFLFISKCVKSIRIGPNPLILQPPTLHEIWYFMSLW